MKCCICGIEPKSGKLGNGWKQKGNGQVFCPIHMKETHYIRSIEIPIASVVEGPGDDFGKSFKNAFYAEGRKITRLANWARHELDRNDIEILPGMDKLPKCPSEKKGGPFYLYGTWCTHGPFRDGDHKVNPTTANCVFRQVMAKYKAKRFDVLIANSGQFESYKFPQPIPFHNKQWKAEWLGEDPSQRTPVISLSIGEDKYKVRLRGGKGFLRQKESFAKLISGEAIGGEMALYWKAANEGDRRFGIFVRRNTDNVFGNIMCKMVMWLPKDIVKRRPKVLTVTTDPESFLVASFGDSEVWRLNCDYYKRRTEAYYTQLHRLADDQKAERRFDKSSKMIAIRRDLIVNNFNNFKSSFIHERAREVANYAKRHNCSEVMYRDDVKSYLPTFAWFDLETKLKEKIEGEYGITFTKINDRSKQGSAKREVVPGGKDESDAKDGAMGAGTEVRDSENEDD